MKWLSRRRLIRLGLLLAATYAVGCAVLAWLVVYPPSPDPVELEGFESVTVDGDVELAASYRPGKGRAVVLLHGYREHRGFLGVLAQELAGKTGWALLVPDQRGCGHSESAPSTAGITEVRDAEAAIDFLEDKGHAPEDIAVVGFSMGAVAGLRAAARRPLGGLVLLSPYRDLRTAYDARTRRFVKLPIGFVTPALWGICWLAGEDVFAVDLLAEARACRARKRIVLSETHDWRAPLDDARAIARALGARLVEFRGGDHTLRANPAAHDECIAVLTSWFGD